MTFDRYLGIGVNRDGNRNGMTTFIFAFRGVKPLRHIQT